MKSIKIALAFFLFSNLCYSHTGWYQVNSGTNKTLYSICFINLNTGFAAGEKGTLLKTVTTGASWQNISLNDTNLTIQKIYFRDQSTGFVLAYKNFPDNSVSQIFRTTNSGANWFSIQTEYSDCILMNIEFTPSGIGYISGGGFPSGPNIFLKSTNGGVSWFQIETKINRAAISQKFTDEFTGFMGCEGQIYKTTNGGLNWSVAFEYYKSRFVNSIKFINLTTGYACGGSFTTEPNQNTRCRYIIKTTNGGVNWNFLFNDSLSGIIYDILTFNEGIIYGCGSAQDGFVLRTTNGGINWIVELSSSFTPLYNIANSNTKGFAVGLNGAIYKKDNIVSISQTGTEIPTSINLYQNYPNPFNPETTIKFDLTKSGFISLKVYDTSGKEIQNLFNGVKEAGSYQLKFDGASLNSGVYFYRLLTNGTTITKSMVLVK